VYREAKIGGGSCFKQWFTLSVRTLLSLVRAGSHVARDYHHSFFRSTKLIGKGDISGGLSVSPVVKKTGGGGPRERGAQDKRSSEGSGWGREGGTWGANHAQEAYKAELVVSEGLVKSRRAGYRKRLNLGGVGGGVAKTQKPS